ncbi:MAG: hypothetical protein K5905_23865 [Roseibium sp.]|uniref:hypothetical protein n=1 Tax=Roseibium sp. TaxID=1936156 RepID=UPI0026228151|nr:hypothetical protein [Roseibium sp.]MCV0428506.1 hypothetical protein [Roseibium sp.]
MTFSLITARSRRKRQKRGRLARANWLYTQQDVQALYDVCRNTVLNWMKYGLKSIEAERRLFLGSDLNAFHAERKRNAKTPCGRFEIYCTACKSKHSLLVESFKVETKGQFRTRVVLTCPETGKKASSFMRESVLDELRHTLESKSSAETPV